MYTAAVGVKGMKSFVVSSAFVSGSILLLAACSALTSPDDVLESSSTVGKIRIDARILERDMNHYVIAVDVTNTGANAVDVGVDWCMPTALYPASPLRLRPVWHEPMGCPDIVRDTPTPLLAHETRRVTRDVPLYAYLSHPTQAPDPGSYLVAVLVRINTVDALREFWMATGEVPISIAR